MVSFNFLAGVLTVCLAVSLCASEVNERHNYNILMRKLNNGVVTEERGSSDKRGNDDIGAELHLSTSGFCDNDTRCTNRYGREEKNNTGAAGAEAEKGNGGDSIFMNGIRDIGYFYEKCRRKIDRGFKERSEFRTRFKIANELLKIRKKIHSLHNCMKVTSFRHFDHFLSGEVIPVMKYFELVRDNANDTTGSNYSNYNSKIYVSEILSKNWMDLIVERIEKLFKGHSLKVHLDGNKSEVSGRGRRRDHRMFAMMMMGFIIMASVLVPMGFQFLIVLGGKSLLMAKMALIMSAINGLKKIATSNVGYGLYHAPEAFHHDPHHGYHEKIFHIKPQEQPNSPFNIVV